MARHRQRQKDERLTRDRVPNEMGKLMCVNQIWHED